MDLIYQHAWTGTGITVNAYVHQLKNYRYNWHENEYELNIVLTGSAEFVRGNDYFTLECGDMILINPGTGHASYSLMDKTSALVIHMTAEVFQPLLEMGQSFRFMYVTDYKTRNTSTARKLRYYATALLLALAKPDRLNIFRSRALVDLIAALLVDEVPRTIVPYHKEDALHKQAIRTMTGYMQEHYAEPFLWQTKSNPLLPPYYGAGMDHVFSEDGQRGTLLIPLLTVFLFYSVILSA